MEYTSISIDKNALALLQECREMYSKFRPTVTELVQAGCVAIKENGLEKYIEKVRKK